MFSIFLLNLFFDYIFLKLKFYNCNSNDIKKTRNMKLLNTNYDINFKKSQILNFCNTKIYILKYEINFICLNQLNKSKIKRKCMLKIIH
jgi:hypothetical protein